MFPLTATQQFHADSASYRSDPPRQSARGQSRAHRQAMLACWCAIAAGTLSAAPGTDLLNDPKLTPKRFAAYFENFEYELGAEVQSPAEFLSRRKGDCDDYAILADHVLKQRGYDTRLIHVRMVGRIAHAVCYVFEDRIYLDYNNRKFFLNLQRCGATLREIATKVSDSFEANWTSASEFTYDYESEQKQYMVTVVKTDPPALDRDAMRNRPPAPSG